MLLLTLIHFGEGDQYFHLETISSRLSTKAKTRITLQEMQFLRKFFFSKIDFNFLIFYTSGGHSQQSG